MLYVALTRAKEKLIIFATTKDYDKLKDNLFVIEKENKIEDVLVSKNSRYFENILMALKIYEKENRDDIFDINVINVGEYDTQEKLSEVFKQDENITSPLAEKIEELSSLESKGKEEISKNLEIIKENIDSVYRYIDDTNTLSRISVSELKKKEQEENLSTNIYESKDHLSDAELGEESESFMENTNKFKMPEILCDVEDNYTAVRKGILVHFILENLDMNISSKEELKKYIENLVLKGTISENDKKYINVTRIYNFLNSKIGMELKNAKNIFREYEFILKDKSISKSVIQGVIDLFYITNDGKVVLVDFKTDRVFEEEVFITRYKKQLDIYKEAIEKLLNMKVLNTYIYSFSLNKEIEIK